MSEHVPDAWVEMPSEDDVRAMLGEAAEGFEYDFGFYPAMTRLVLAHPEIGPAFGMAFAQVMFAPGELTRKEREMVASVTAAAQDCFY